MQPDPDATIRACHPGSRGRGFGLGFVSSRDAFGSACRPATWRPAAAAPRAERGAPPALGCSAFSGKRNTILAKALRIRQDRDVETGGAGAVMGERAVAYLRTSSATNVDGDSAHRQNAAMMAHAARGGLAVVVCFWDAAVSGADPVEMRTGFAAMIDHAARDGLTTILVEDASRFARSVIAQELGVLLLASRGIRVVTASGQDLTDSSDPAKVMFRQIAGAFAQYEKAKLVERLRRGRERVRATRGKCEEGRR